MCNCMCDAWGGSPHIPAYVCWCHSWVSDLVQTEITLAYAHVELYLKHKSIGTMVTPSPHFLH